ncbi:MAG: D-alanyl-lipoteichoic acid biosynthesis protein DltB [Firmicutes bacterium]|nr:D-alanyl-lipoteichoic acid biosynthesis protein DltB [Bacillota bacterium]
MSFFSGLPFWTALIVIAVCALANGLLEKSFKRFGIFVSVFIVTLVLSSDIKQLIYFAAYFIFELVIVKIYERLRKDKGRISWIYHLMLLASLLPLVLCKLTELKPLSEMDWFKFAGISYLTFRVAQIIIELYDGVIKEVRTPDFLAFLVFFPTFSCGPIDRSRRFSEDLNRTYKRNEYLELYGKGLEKIMLGLLYKYVLAEIFFKLMSLAVEAEGPAVQNPLFHFGIIVGYAYSYGLYMFFDFAGYSLMAIGTGYMLGIKVPDNFRQPFKSRDMKEFWERWHISLSEWFRDFLFSRFVMLSMRKKWFKNRLTSASLGFIINMGIMGVWHGLSINYIIYGLYHGVLLAITEIYQKKSKFYKKNKKKKWYIAVSWFITLNLVMFGFLIFSGNFTRVCFSV